MTAHPALAPERKSLTAETIVAGSNLARFMEMRGIRVVSSAGAYWYESKPRFFAALPFEAALAPDRGELKAMLKSLGGLAARYVCAEGRGASGGLYVCNPASFSIASVNRKDRSKVRKGLQAFDIRPVREREFADDGFEPSRQTLARQNRVDREFAAPDRWKQFVSAVYSAPGMSVMGAFEGGRLVSYLISCRDGMWLHTLYKMSLDTALDNCCAWALDYTVVVEAAKDPTLVAVSNGLTSSNTPVGVHRYKLHFGYEVWPVSLAVVLHPALAPICVNGIAKAALRAMNNVVPANGTVRSYIDVLRGANEIAKTDVEDPDVSERNERHP